MTPSPQFTLFPSSPKISTEMIEHWVEQPFFLTVSLSEMAPVVSLCEMGRLGTCDLGPRDELCLGPRDGPRL